MNRSAGFQHGANERATTNAPCWKPALRPRSGARFANARSWFLSPRQGSGERESAASAMVFVFGCARGGCAFSGRERAGLTLAAEVC